MKKILRVILVLLFIYPLFPAESISREEILEKPVWKNLLDEYKPDPGLIAILRSKVTRLTSIDVYFAFWCGDSENNVPPFIKLIDEIGSDRIRVNYYIEERKKSGEKYYFEKLKVERIPTFIFFKDGKEVGRITENPKKTLEEDFLDIIF